MRLLIGRIIAEHRAELAAVGRLGVELARPNHLPPGLVKDALVLGQRLVQGALVLGQWIVVDAISFAADAWADSLNLLRGGHFVADMCRTPQYSRV